MTELSDHYMRVRDYARRFSLDESTVYKMIERAEIKAIRIGKKTLRIPSSELERYLEREPTADPEALSLEKRAEAFRKANGKDPGSFVDAWRSGSTEDTPENAEVALEAVALRTALARRHVAAA
jgi:excisionase family DNA binding protein